MRLIEACKNTRGRVVAVLLVLALVAGGAYYHHQRGVTAAGQEFAADSPGGGRMGGNRPQSVAATRVTQGDFEVGVGALGTVTASNVATVRARVSGPIVRVAFREGQTVRAGDLLVEIDPRSFQIVVDQAQGQLLKDQALLAAARVDLERYRGLLAKDSIAKQQVDTQEALVRQYEGTVAADQAQVADARLQLAFTRVTAPAGGRLGLRQVDVGNIVSSSDSTGIVVITQTQPIHLVFAIPSVSLGDVVSRLQAGKQLTVEAWDRDNSSKLGEGRLIAVDNQVDVNTGTVKLKAEFANADNGLFPNQFVNARLRIDTRRQAVLLAAAAIQRDNQGAYVFVIDTAARTVTRRPVVLGPGDAEHYVVESGLQTGELVVLDGADRLRDGGKVTVVNIDGEATPDTAAATQGAAAGGNGERRHRRPSDASAPAAEKPAS
jgi:membrane fusion protein, multidrug efflux system